jgi:hypothetical protein
MHMLLSKTNLYDSSALIITIELLDYFFGYFKKNKKKLPSTFVYQYFFEAVKMVL